MLWSARPLVKGFSIPVEITCHASQRILPKLPLPWTQLAKAHSIVKNSVFGLYSMWLNWVMNMYTLLLPSESCLKWVSGRCDVIRDSLSIRKALFNLSFISKQGVKHTNSIRWIMTFIVNQVPFVKITDTTFSQPVINFIGNVGSFSCC